jgi:hypothetical protein
MERSNTLTLDTPNFSSLWSLDFFQYPVSEAKYQVSNMEQGCKRPDSLELYEKLIIIAL